MTDKINGRPLALIVEDDQNLADIFARALKEAGFYTRLAHDGMMAQQQLAAMVPALVLLDLHLPFVSGEEVLIGIRADDRLIDTKVVLATADASLGGMLRDQADFLLDKPVSFRQLKALAERLERLSMP